MTTTQFKEKVTEVKEKAVDLMKGEFTLTTLDFFLIGAVCLLAGICIGLLTAPFTHGISIGSNNGNNNGNINNNTDNDTPADDADRQKQE